MALLRRRRDVAPESPMAAHPDLVAISTAAPRRRIVIEGQVVRMRARPTSGQPSLAVTISDSSGSATAVWTGRRAIGGITLGRRLRVEGVATFVGSQLEFTNPSYTLLP